MEFEKKDFLTKFSNLQKNVNSNFNFIEDKLKATKIYFFDSYKNLHLLLIKYEKFVSDLFLTENPEPEKDLQHILNWKLKEKQELEIYKKIIMENKHEFKSFWNILDIGKTYKDALQAIIEKKSNSFPNSKNEILINSKKKELYDENKLLKMRESELEKRQKDNILFYKKIIEEYERTINELKKRIDFLEKEKNEREKEIALEFESINTKMKFYVEENMKMKELFDKINEKMKEITKYERNKKNGNMNDFNKLEKSSNKNSDDILENSLKKVRFNDLNEIQNLDDQDISELKKSFKKELKFNKSEIKSVKDEINDIITSLKKNVLRDSSNKNKSKLFAQNYISDY